MTTSKETSEPTFTQESFMHDYSQALDMLRLSSRAFAVMTSNLGYPVANANIPTAQVSLDVANERINFEINPHFLHSLKESEAAGLIGHETYHVLLDHLSEMTNEEAYPDQQTLVEAQECIINDRLQDSVGFRPPAGGMFGPELHQHDFSRFSTQEGYDFIQNKKQKQNSDEANNDSSNADKPENADDSNDSTSDSAADSSNPADESAAGADDSSEAEKSDAPQNGCGGIKVIGNDNGEKSPEELQKLIKKIIATQTDEALKELNTQNEDLPPELEELIEDLQDSGVKLDETPNQSSSPLDKDSFSVIDSITNGMPLAWVDLLARINPKIKESRRRKVTHSWHSPNRRMIETYPEIILPNEKKEGLSKGAKGDAIPVFIIALDMSISIPTTLLADLSSLASSIPDHLIKAMPITWSNNYRIFDPANPREICARSITNVKSVYDYAVEVNRTMKLEPYVLVITDGGFRIPSVIPRELTKAKWSWMAIEDHDIPELKNATRGYADSEKLLKLSDFVR